MKLKCTNNGKMTYISLEYIHHLTYGMVYEGKEYDEKRYLILNDKNEWQPYQKSRFEIVEEEDV